MKTLSERATWRILFVLGVLALSVLATAQPQYFSRWNMWSGPLAGGLLFGTFFGLIALAAVWTVVGWPRRVTRIWQSMVLCGSALVAVLLNGLLSNMPGGQFPAFAGVFGLIAVGQWLLIAIPLWLLLTRRGISFRHVGEMSPDVRATDQQFGIREILIVTAVTASLLSAIRWLFASQPWAPDESMRRSLMIFGYLALCNVFVTLPLLVAPLLRRFAHVSTLIALAFIALITSCEVPAFHQVERNSTNERIVWITLWVMNYVQAMWVLLALGTLRAGGYRLAAGQTTGPAAMIAVNQAEQS